VRFAGRTALVTGGARGIGAATVRRLAAEGAAVIIGDLNQEQAAELAAELGGQSLACPLDVGDSASWAELADVVADRFGGLDVIVNNAYLRVISPAADLAEDEWNRQIAVSLGSIYHSVRAFLPTLRERRGCMVNVSSVHALAGWPGHPAYAAAKGGMLALTRQLAVEYGPAVRFNAVVPGSIRTPIWDGLDESELSEAAAKTALGRLGRADEVAAAAAFLASEDASYITGAALLVDGGLMARRP
jgi:NAD(P)-dependent dehydrogenase (short-subunit alcohol dehydrogenase family)